MHTQIIPLKLNRTNLTAVFKKDLVFSFALLLAILSCFFASPKMEYLNFSVLASLFNLMIVVKAFEEQRVLDKFAVSIINRCTDSRRVSLVMILLSFFSSMLITNDIALLTLVPLTLIISRKTGMNVLVTVILQTLAANIGSSLTPMGNPQNLYIVSHYQLTAAQFFPPLMLFAASGLIWLTLLNMHSPRYDLDIALKPIAIRDKSKIFIWVLLFGLVILSVFRLIHYGWVLLLTVLSTSVLNKKLFLKVDYLLLLTFVCFFVFIGNISGIPEVSNFMARTIQSTQSTYFGAILLSQAVSNVPSSIFLSKFTSSWRELLLGVNIGGMGTIIASLASVISYKLYIKEKPESSKEYLMAFTGYNLISLAVFTFINYFLVSQ